MNGLQPDLIVLQGCERPQSEGEECLWFENGNRKSTAVIARNGYRLERGPVDSKLSDSMFPVRVTGPHQFNLIAVWARSSPSYVRAVDQGLNAYADFIKASPTIVVGDFNSHSRLDRKNQKVNHLTLVERLRQEFGLVSAYHETRGEGVVTPEAATLYWQWKESQPFHVDYCFLPSEWAPQIQEVKVSSFAEWEGRSDHRPLVVDVDLTSESQVPALTEGQNVTWKCQPRDGYGYTIEIPAVVKRLGRTKVKIQFASATGKQTFAWVRKSTLFLEPEPEKELVLEVGLEGGGAEIYRTRGDDANWKFHVEKSGLDLDENDEEIVRSSKSKPVNSFEEAVEMLGFGKHLLLVLPLKVHAEYRRRVWEIIREIDRSLTDEFRSRFNTTMSHTLPRWEEVGASMEIYDRAYDHFRSFDELSAAPEVSSDRTEDGRHFLLYWRPDTVDDNKAHRPLLVHAASSQLGEVNKGDTVWIITVRSGELFLVGRIKVGERTDWEGAVRGLGTRDLWDASFHVLAEDGTAEFLQDLSLQELVGTLRFENAPFERLALTDGKVDQEQFKKMLQLTEESARMLTGAWESRDELPVIDDSGYLKAREVDEFLSEKWKEWNDFEEVERNDRIEELKRIVSQNAEDYMAHYNLGVALSDEGRNFDAMEAYEQAIRLAPTYAPAHYNLGGIFIELGRPGFAEKEFEEAVRLDPNFAPAHFMLGVVYGALGKHCEAIEATKRGIKVDPDDPRAYFNIGHAYMQLKEFENAVSWFEQAVNVDPGFPPAYFEMGKSYRMRGLIKEEIDAYVKAVEADGEYVDALFALGAAYARLRRGEKANVEYLESHGGLELNDPRSFYYLGLAFLALGQTQIVKDRLNDLREMDPALADDLESYVVEIESERPELPYRETLKWLEPDENPFGVKVLDCSQFSSNLNSASDEETVERFESLQHSRGEEYRGSLPENARQCVCALEYPGFVQVPDGPLFTAETLEDKWHIYLYGQYLYFVRSWTGRLVYRATVRFEAGSMTIRGIDFASGGDNNETDGTYAVRAVDFLFRSHLQKKLVPHPVPKEIGSEPPAVGQFSFSQFGRWAQYATMEDSSRCPDKGEFTPSRKELVDLNGQAIDLAELKPGDLVTFDHTNRTEKA
jgi:tetratricopeptide (TPR) repeat protein